MNCQYKGRVQPSNRVSIYYNRPGCTVCFESLSLFQGSYRHTSDPLVSIPQTLQLKIGDRVVKARGDGPGRMGTVASEVDPYGAVQITSDETWYHGNIYWYIGHLEKVEQMPEFKIGDRVRTIDSHETGIVKNVNSISVTVIPDNGMNSYVYWNRKYIEKVDNVMPCYIIEISDNTTSAKEIAELLKTARKIARVSRSYYNVLPNFQSDVEYSYSVEHNDFTVRTL